MTRLVLAMCLLACTGSGSPPPSTPDASTTCSGLPYEPCTDDAQCITGRCHTFMGMGFSACSLTCSPDSGEACPPEDDGTPVPCSQGQSMICRPTKVTACTPAL